MVPPDKTPVAAPANWQQGVRARPGMYFGGIGEMGVGHLLRELVSNGIDEFLAGRASAIRVRLEGNSIEVSDDGAGLAFEPVGVVPGVACLTSFHSTRSADNHAPHIHLHGSCGVGLAPVNAACSRFDFRTWRNGRRWEQQFQAGVPVSPPRIVRDKSGRGTRIFLAPDVAVFGPTTVSAGKERARLFVAAHLFPRLTIHFQSETFHAPGGLADLAALDYHLHRPADRRFPTPRVFRFHAKAGDLTLSAAATGTASGKSLWSSWVNGSRTVDGTHCEGFRDALRLARWKPAVVLLHAVMHEPRYAGPVRDYLEVPEIRGQVSQALAPSLREFLQGEASRGSAPVE